MASNAAAISLADTTTAPTSASTLRPAKESDTLAHLLSQLQYPDLASDVKSLDQFKYLLDRPTDSASLIALIPSIESLVMSTEQDLGSAVEILSLVLREMARHNMLAVLPVMLDIFSRRILVDIDSLGGTELDEAYRPVILALGTFTRQSSHSNSPTGKLHRPAQAHILRLVKTLVNQLDSIPTMSTSTPPRLSPQMLALLFEPPFLHPELMRYLLDYTRSRRITCSSRIWWKCHILAVDEGDMKAARRFKAMAATAAKQEGKGKAGRQDLHGQDNMAGTGKDIAALISARMARSVAHFLDLAEDQLSFPSTTNGVGGQSSAMVDYAWSNLLHTSRHDRSIDQRELTTLHDSLPPETISGHTLTPIMLGLLERGAMAEAWEVWLELVDLDRQSHSQRSRNGSGDDSETYVDRTALAVGTYVCHAHLGLDAAIRLVDAWAAKPDPTATEHGGVPLDAQNINVLLTLCRRDKRPSIAVRLFGVALPRWGVYTDDISLTLLLDTCRYASASDLDLDAEGSRHDLRDRLRLLADELRFTRSSGSGRPIEKTRAGSRDYALGPVGTALLDPVGYTWRKEHRSGAPWSYARDIIREIVMANWPHLADIASPLDFERGPYAHQTRDLASFFRRSPSSSPSTSCSLSMYPPAVDHCAHVHLVPSANTFHSYIALLGYYNLPHEIPTALAWMRQLDLRPHRRTMLLALTYLGEVEGPRRLLVDWEDGQSRLVRDTEVLRRWLTEWLGETTKRGKGVPAEEDVASYRRALFAANRRLTA